MTVMRLVTPEQWALTSALAKLLTTAGSLTAREATTALECDFAEANRRLRAWRSAGKVRRRRDDAPPAGGRTGPAPWRYFARPDVVLAVDIDFDAQCAAYERCRAMFLRLCEAPAGMSAKALRDACEATETVHQVSGRLSAWKRQGRVTNVVVRGDAVWFARADQAPPLYDEMIEQVRAETTSVIAAKAKVVPWVAQLVPRSRAAQARRFGATSQAAGAGMG